MQHPFLAIEADYQSALSRMQITRLTAVEATAERLVGFIDAGRYDAGCKAEAVPVAWAAASFEREASSNFNDNPAQGWPLSSRSRDVPYNGLGGTLQFNGLSGSTPSKYLCLDSGNNVVSSVSAC